MSERSGNQGKRIEARGSCRVVGIVLDRDRGRWRQRGRECDVAGGLASSCGQLTMGSRWDRRGKDEALIDKAKCAEGLRSCRGRRGRRGRRVRQW